MVRNPARELARATPDPTDKQTLRQNGPGASTAGQASREDFSDPNSTTSGNSLSEPHGPSQQHDISSYGFADIVGTNRGSLRNNVTVQGTAQSGQPSFPSMNSSRSANSQDLRHDRRSAEPIPDSESRLNRQSANWETELLKHYRYHIATILDLGTGSLYFGVQVLVRSHSSKSVYYAILALASSQRSLTDASTRSEDHVNSLMYATQAKKDFGTAIFEDQVLTSILLAWRTMLVTTPGLWHERANGLVRQFGGLDESLAVELRQIAARLSLSAILIAPPESLDLSYLGHAAFSPKNKETVPQQLQQSFVLLENALTVSNGAGRTTKLVNSMGLSAWKTCWKDVQNWHLARIEEMQQIFELTNADAFDQRAEDQLDFPVIVFSNASATVANIIHHATALLLLQQKPRLSRAGAEDQSSISPMWHALRVLGIATTASKEGIWDPIVASAVIYAARKLSNEKQLSIVTDVLRTGSRLTGMKFEEEIEKLHQGHNISTDQRQRCSWFNASTVSNCSTSE